MNSSRLLSEVVDEGETEVLVERSLADNDPSEVLLEALAETALDLTETDRALGDQVDTDALDALFRESDENTQFSAVVWDYPVVLTSDVVVIFDALSDSNVSA